MNNSLHVASTYKIEYSTKSIGENLQETINLIILENAMNPHFSNNEDKLMSNSIDLDIEDFEDVIETLEDMTDEEYIESYIFEVKSTRQQIIDILKYLYEHREKHDDYIHLKWF